MRNFITIIVVLTFLLCGCTGGNRGMLKQADAIMEQDADSALTILNTIDKNTLNKRDLPYFALLMTQAQIKNDIPLTSDSIMSIAYRKYAEDWNGDKGIRSNFYMGEIFFNQDKARDAMKYYLTAYNESKRLDNDYWRAKSAERIADLFFYAYIYDEAAKFRKEAIEFFGKAGRVTNQRYAVADLATVLMNDSKPDDALSILDSLYTVCTSETEKDAYLLDYIRIGKINTLILLKKFDKLTSDDINLIEDPRFNRNKTDSEILKLQIPGVYKESLSESEIIQYLKDAKLSPEDKAQAYYTCYLEIKSKQNSSLKFDIVDSLIFYQDALTRDIIKESVTAAERDFYLSSSERSQRKAKMTITIALLLFSFVVIVVFIVWRFHRLKDLARKAELEANIESFIELKTHSENLNKKISKLEETVRNKGNYIDELKNTESQLRSDINEKEKCINRLESDIEIQLNNIIGKDAVLQTLFKEKWTTLNMLCNEYYEKGDSSNTRRYILDSIEKELKKISSKKGLNQIEAAVDAHFDGIIGLLRKECPHLSEKDITLAILIIAGFSGKSISYLMGIKTGNYYVSKRRLVDKIIASETPYQKKFIDEICQ